MKISDEVWDALGSLSEDEIFQVMTKLFAHYEGKLEHNPENGEALAFFKNLGNVIAETSQCNSNRR
ncbi:MAG: hypothetical protein OEY01_07705 [Desulfobulbaceae bacterium]|nr:hypothetical protein [Desulfobulbaceae bacterium]HIJ78940.1 hypothetical protein [Deltaproteobacteria bacterium]